jgi:RimJ/RimL family protein N-acetyltransferase
VTDIRRTLIRRLEPADAALYREIRLEALQKNPEAFGSTFEREDAQPLSWFEAAIGHADVFGAFLDGKLAGIAGFSAREGSKQAHKGVLWAMYVCDVARGCGLGKQLVGAVLAHARGRVEMVQLTVVSENEAACRLYRSMGFVEYGYEKRALKQNGRYFDEFLMVNFLDTGSN